MTTPTTTPQEAAIEAIRQEVARYGKPTPRSLGWKIANSVSTADYQQAIREGLARYEGDAPRSDWSIR